LGDHLPTELLRAVPDAVDVDIHDEAPLLLSDLQGCPVNTRAGVVYQHIDLTESIQDLIDRTPHLIGLGDVCGHCNANDPEAL
jgi:hypothetical protein